MGEPCLKIFFKIFTIIIATFLDLLRLWFYITRFKIFWPIAFIIFLSMLSVNWNNLDTIEQSSPHSRSSTNQHQQQSESKNARGCEFQKAPEQKPYPFLIEPVESDEISLSDQKKEKEKKKKLKQEDSFYESSSDDFSSDEGEDDKDRRKVQKRSTYNPARKRLALFEDSFTF